MSYQITLPPRIRFGVKSINSLADEARRIRKGIEDAYWERRIERTYIEDELGWDAHKDTF